MKNMKNTKLGKIRRASVLWHIAQRFVSTRKLHHLIMGIPLNGLGTPSTICLSHVLWWLNGRHEFESAVGDTHKPDYGTCNDWENMVV